MWLFLGMGVKTEVYINLPEVMGLESKWEKLRLKPRFFKTLKNLSHLGFSWEK